MKISVRSIVLCSALLGLSAPAPACRFWGLVGDWYPPDLIADHLRDGSVTSLRQLAATYKDGWGVAYIPSASSQIPLNRPVFRRGGPSADNPAEPEFSLAVEEMELLRPRAAIAHVRGCSVSPCGIPDPHPFQHEGILFAHHGTISTTLLVSLLTGDDPDYLKNHPPDYSPEVIDSELYFLYLLKYGHQHPDLPRAEALRRAVVELARLTSSRLSFVLAEGDTLYALRHARSDENDPVRYYPDLSGPSPFWAAASQALGSSTETWATIPPMTLAVLVPGSQPELLPTMENSGIEEHPVGMRLQIGRARPNPARRGILFPLAVPPGGASVELEIWDARGRLVWREGPRAFDPGARDLVWDARDRQGRLVPSGAYFCAVRSGTDRWGERVTIVR